MQVTLVQASMLASRLNSYSSCDITHACLGSVAVYFTKEVLEYVYASAFVSVCPYNFAGSPGQLPGNCGMLLSTRLGSRRFHMLMVLIRSTGLHWWMTGTGSQKAKSQTIAGISVKWRSVNNILITWTASYISATMVIWLVVTRDFYF